MIRVVLPVVQFSFHAIELIRPRREPDMGSFEDIISLEVSVTDQPHKLTASKPATLRYSVNMRAFE